MMKRCKVGAMLLMVGGFISSVTAYEFRAPLISERGMMRYIFDEDRDIEDGYRLNMWSATHTREAHKAFRSHGTNAKELPTVFFGKEEFRLSEIFPDSKPALDTKFYNPYMRVLKIKPRATYHERGATFGGRIDFPVWERKGRLGVRATIPFREVQIECNDKQGRDTAQIQDLIASDHVNNPEDNNNNDVVLGHAWRLDFLEALIQSHDNRSVVTYEDNPASKEGAAFVDQPSKTTEVDPANAEGEDVKVFVMYSPEGTIPCIVGTRENDHAGGDHTLMAPNGMGILPTDLGVFTDDKFYVFNDNDYTGLSNANNPNAANISLEECLKQQQRKSELWVSTVHQTNGLPVAGTQAIISGIENAIKAFRENHFEWMHDRGFDFETDRAFSIGDVDIDLFYEHQFDDDMIGEVFIGLRLPTGPGHKYHRNPFEVHLGNGEHCEIRFGVLGAWQALDWMNVKVDALWSFVLDDSEIRSAGFKGAQVKNIGPRVKADVDWGYLVLNIDFNFFHPKDKKLTSMIGYQLYYKTEDNVSFKCKTVESWLGKKFNTTTNLYDVENNAELDNDVLEKRTEQVAHRLRMETSYRFSDWFEGFAGSVYSFAGQNIAREVDYHCGMNVSF